MYITVKQVQDAKPYCAMDSRANRPGKPVSKTFSVFQKSPARILRENKVRAQRVYSSSLVSSRRFSTK